LNTLKRKLLFSNYKTPEKRNKISSLISSESKNKGWVGKREDGWGTGKIS